MSELFVDMSAQRQAKSIVRSVKGAVSRYCKISETSDFCKQGTELYLQARIFDLVAGTRQSKKGTAVCFLEHRSRVQGSNSKEAWFDISIRVDRHRSAQRDLEGIIELKNSVTPSKICPEIERISNFACNPSIGRRIRFGAVVGVGVLQECDVKGRIREIEQKIKLNRSRFELHHAYKMIEPKHVVIAFILSREI